MGYKAEKFQTQTAEKCGLFSSLFSWAGYLFANCSKLPQRIATIVWHNKGALRENRTDIPHNLRKVLPAKAHAGTFPCGCGRSSGAQQAHKKLSPVSMRGNSQNGGQTTKSLLIKPQCSGVPIQQAVSLSSSFPRHCLLFVCAFFRKMQAGAWSEELPLPRSPAYKNRPGIHCGNRGGCQNCRAFGKNDSTFSSLHESYSRNVSCSIVTPYCKILSIASINSRCIPAFRSSFSFFRYCSGRFRPFLWYCSTKRPSIRMGSS